MKNPNFRMLDRTNDLPTDIDDGVYLNVLDTGCGCVGSKLDYAYVPGDGVVTVLGRSETLGRQIDAIFSNERNVVGHIASGRPLSRAALENRLGGLRPNLWAMVTHMVYTYINNTPGLREEFAGTEGPIVSFEQHDAGNMSWTAVTTINPMHLGVIRVLRDYYRDDGTHDGMVKLVLSLKQDYGVNTYSGTGVEVDGL